MVNRVVLIGRITKEPEATTTASGITLVRFTIAVNRSYKDANGERKADFISCVAWKSQAEFISKYIKKGNQMSVEGRIQTGSYTDSDNKTIYTTDVLVESVSSLEPKQDNQVNNNNSTASDDDLPF